MLFEEWFVVESGGEHGEFVLGFVDAECFLIGPAVVVRLPHAGHLVGSICGDEGDVFGVGFEDYFVEEFFEWEAGPGYVHGPGFDAAEVVDAFFVLEFEEVVEIEGGGIFAESGDFDFPRLDDEFFNELVYLAAFAGQEFVVVVVHGGYHALGDREILEVVFGVGFCREDIGSLEGWDEEIGNLAGDGCWLLGEGGLDGSAEKWCGEGAAGCFEAEVGDEFTTIEEYFWMGWCEFGEAAVEFHGCAPVDLGLRYLEFVMRWYVDNVGENGRGA